MISAAEYICIYLVGDLLKFKKTKEVFVPFIFSPTFSSTFCESCWFMWNIRERFEILWRIFSVKKGFTFSEVLFLSLSLQNWMRNPRRRIATTRPARTPTTCSRGLCIRRWILKLVIQFFFAKSDLKHGKLGQLRPVLFLHHRNLLPSRNFRIMQVTKQEQTSSCFQIFARQRLAWICEGWRRHWEGGRCHWAPPSPPAPPTPPRSSPSPSLSSQPGKLFHGEPLPSSSSWNFDKSEFIGCHLWLSTALVLNRVVCLRLNGGFSQVKLKEL